MQTLYNPLFLSIHSMYITICIAFSMLHLYTYFKEKGTKMHLIPMIGNIVIALTLIKWIINPSSGALIKDNIDFTFGVIVLLIFTICNILMFYEFKRINKANYLLNHIPAEIKI